jgi:hypothetical protein
VKEATAAAKKTSWYETRLAASHSNRYPMEKIRQKDMEIKDFSKQMMRLINSPAAFASSCCTYSVKETVPESKTL